MMWIVSMVQPCSAALSHLDIIQAHLTGGGTGDLLLVMTK